MAWAWGKSKVANEVPRGLSASTRTPTGELQDVGNAAGAAGTMPFTAHANEPAVALESQRQLGNSAPITISNAAASLQQPVLPLSPEAINTSIAMRLMSASFGNIVWLMIRSPQYQGLRLADLEWIVIPALLSQQYMVMEQTDRITGKTGPVSAALWCRVSSEIEDRIIANVEARKIIQLSPGDWTSGDKYWLIAAIGAPEAVKVLLGRLREGPLSRVVLHGLPAAFE